MKTSDLTSLIYIFDKKELRDHQNECVVITVYRKGKKIDCSNFPEILLLLTSYKIYSTSFPQGEVHM
jgi:hypothetical protein